MLPPIIDLALPRWLVFSYLFALIQFTSLLHSSPTHTTAMMNTLTVGDAIEVYWPADKQYYAGRVAACKVRTGTYRIHYDDGEVEDLDLAKELWRAARSKPWSRKVVEKPLKPYASIYGQTRVRSPVAVTTVQNSAPLPSSRSSPRFSFKQKTASQPPPKTKKRGRKQSHPRRLQETSQRSVEHLQGKSPSPSRAQHANVTALLLIEKCVDSWLRNEIRRQFDMFSMYQCLTHTFNMLTYAAVDPSYQSKLLINKDTTPKWISAVTIPDSRRKMYEGWREPHSEDEWRLEKLMLADISALVQEGIDKSDRSDESSDENERDVVEAMRYILYARELCSHRR